MLESQARRANILRNPTKKSTYYQLDCTFVDHSNVMSTASSLNDDNSSVEDFSQTSCSTSPVDHAVGSDNFKKETYTWEGSPKPELIQRSFTQKLKTELCKRFMLDRTCPFGSRCSFAHGTSELRHKVLVSANYKTVKCKRFHKDMYCSFGPRCQFVHKKHHKNANACKLKNDYKLILKILESVYPALETKDHFNLENFLSEFSDMTVYKRSKLGIFESLCNASIEE